MNLHSNRMFRIAPVGLAALSAVSAQAASLQKVNQSDWQGGVSLPSYVNMYVYVPDNRATKPPILVASHHCQGTGTTTYNETKSTFVSQADKNGYIIVFPEATGHNCWDVGSAKSLKHDGGGDTHAIAQMVRYTIGKYGADASRVYAFGGSSGAMMTQALLGIYPDIFMAGVAVSGVPCGCWAEGYSGDVATNGQWSGPCAGGNVTKTPQEWGNLVRSMFAGYTGHRARVQLWHGDPDPTISFVNFGEAIDEWTNVLGLTATPTKTDNPNTSTTHQYWNNTCGFKVLETFAIKGAGHGVQWDLATASSFLGLDKVGEQDPELAACGSTGTGGAGGSSGVGGAATGGRATVGGASGMGGSPGGSGAGGAATGGVRNAGGSASGGAAAGGARAVGGTATGGAALGGTDARGGSTSSTDAGGARTSGGSSALGGGLSYGGAVGNGGTPTNGGSPAGTDRSGGASAIAGTPAQSSGGIASTNVPSAEDANGCSCAIPGKSSSDSSGRTAALVLGALIVALRRRQQPRGSA